MASRAKPKGSTPRTSRKRKPATIDLEAKEVVKDASADANPPDTSQKPAGEAKKSGSDRKSGTTTSNDPGAPIEQKSSARSASKSDAAQFGRGSSSGASSKKPEFATPASISKSLTAGGFVNLLFSAVLGGIIAIGGLGAIGQMKNASSLPLIGSLYQTSVPATNTADTGEAVARLQAQLDELTAASENAQPVDLSPFDTRISSLEASITRLTELQSGSTALASSLSELETQMSAIDMAISEIASIETEGTAPSNDPKIAASLIDLGARIGVLEQSGNTVDQQSSISSGQIAELEAEIDKLSSQVIPDLTPLETRLDEADSTVAAIRESLAINSKKLSDLSAMSSELTEQIQSTKVSEKVARSVAANALGGALSSGESLSVPISSIEALSGPTDETTRLAELSDAGIAGLVELSREFEIFASKIEAPHSIPAEAGLVEKFMANAKSLITIKPSGPVDGDTVPAILSRIRGHLSTKNLQSIDGEWQQLPEGARTEGAAWIARVNNRIEAMSLYKEISAQIAQN